MSIDWREIVKDQTLSDTFVEGFKNSKPCKVNLKTTKINPIINTNSNYFDDAKNTNIVLMVSNILSNLLN